jgi:divalent metal cation (Fe/Co/Zn/Cd) transporter
MIGVSISTYFNLPVVDSITSIIIGLLLLVVAIWLAYESKSLLVGEAANPEVIEKIQLIVQQTDEIIAAKNLMTMHMGPSNILLNMEVDFKENLNSTDVEQSIAKLELEIKAAESDIQWVYISAKSFVRTPLELV